MFTKSVFLENFRQSLLSEVEEKIHSASRQFKTGVSDCKHGIYDEFYRNCSSDDGAAYDAGWSYQNQMQQNSKVTFIKCHVL